MWFVPLEPISWRRSGGALCMVGLGYDKTPLKNKRTSPPWKVFAEYLLKVNFSEKVRYEKVDQLGEAVISVIANFL